jgi:hypothetical protein
MKKLLTLLCASVLILSLVACSGKTTEAPGVARATQPAAASGELSATATSRETNTPVATSTISVDYDSDDLSSGTSSTDVPTIELRGDSIAFTGSGATVDGTTITITAAATYRINGTLDDGQVIVDTQDKETVVLVLDGAKIACSSSAPIYVMNADKVVITLADGSENAVTDGETYVLDAESDEPNAAIFSKDDLTINGNGSLTVQANYNNGIASKDDLKITSGTIAVTAVNDGIKGRDSIAIRDGTVIVDAGADGLQANNDEDAEEGYILIEGGTLQIAAGLDGIQAETKLAITGGKIAVSSGGGSANSSSGGNWGAWGGPSTHTSATESAKGLKAGVDVTIGGDAAIEIDASDDALHSNDSLTIDGGVLSLSSGDDGIHADATLTINAGQVTIAQSYEGIESATITIHDGQIHVVSSDDGINAAGGADGSALGGRPGQNMLTETGDQHLYINGGYVAIDAMGDGIDANGAIDMTGGTVIVHGPTANNNGALDYMGAFNISGGLLVAAGSAGMAEAPSASSTQYVIAHTYASTQAAGTIVHIETQDGQALLTFAPSKAYQSIVFSSPELGNGADVIVYSGGRSTGTVADGVYAGGTYAAGTQVTSLTITSIVTGGGATMGGFPGGPGGMRPPGGGRR